MIHAEQLIICKVSNLFISFIFRKGFTHQRKVIAKAVARGVRACFLYSFKNE